MSPPQSLDPEAEAAARTGPGLRLLVPAFMAHLALVLSAGPMLGPAPLAPQLPLLVVGVWALYQPRLMPPWLALLIGIATDLVLDLPVGVHATLLPALAFLLDRARGRPGDARPFWLDWLLAAAVVVLYQWLATELASVGGAPRPFAALLPQAAVTWALFPAVTRVSAWVYGKMAAGP